MKTKDILLELASWLLVLLIIWGVMLMCKN